MMLIGRIPKKFFRSPYLASLFIGTLVFFSLIFLRRTGGLEAMELGAYDWYITLRPEMPGPDPRIALITVSEEDIRTLNQWPLTDSTLAQVLGILARYQPRAIGLDIFRDIPVPPGRQELNAILKDNEAIVAVSKFGEGGVPPPPALKDTEQVGFNDILVDPDGTVRRAILFLDDGKTVFTSFALRLATSYLGAEGIFPRPDPAHPSRIRLGKTAIPPFEPNDGGYVRADARGYQFLLNFRNQDRPFKSYSLADLLSEKIPEREIRDRIVIIGVIAESVKDFFVTPVSRGQRQGSQMAGVELHGLITSQLLGFALGGQSPLATFTENEEALWVFCWAILGSFLGLRGRSPWRFSLWGLGGLLVLGLAAYVAFIGDWWIPLVPAGGAWIASASVVTAYMSNRERRERALLMNLFSRNVSKEVAETLWKERDQFSEGGRPRPQKVVVTALFSDLKGFTSVSEKMDPQELIAWLNTYMESMTKLVMAHGGIVDDYAGDGLKADFGVPVARTEEAGIRQDAVNAVHCALAMEKELLRLNVLWEEKGLPAVGMRIGIFTGPAVAGLLGGSERMKYTTIGDAINTASRLESYDKELAKDAACRILIGESTWRYVAPLFFTERVGEATLKGKADRVGIYRVVGRKGNGPDIKEGEESA
jgi:adenylate cyclase